MTEEPKNMFGKTLDPATGHDEEQAEKIKSDNIKPKIQGKSPTKAAAERAFAGKAAAERKEAERAAAGSTAGPQKGVVQVQSLHIRQDHDTSAAEVAGLHYADEVTILETWSDGKNVWGRVGPDQWVAIRHNAETYIRLA